MTPEKAAAEQYPDPAGELEAEQADRPANDNAEVAANDNAEKPKNNTEAAADLVNSDKGKAALDKIKKWAEDPKSVEGIGKSLSWLDTSAPMRSFRAWWNRRSRLAQWAIMYGSTAAVTPTLLVQNSGIIQTMIKFGFITYKGHVSESGEPLEDAKKMEDEIDRMGGMSDFLVKYGVKVGKYVYPELEAVEPFIEPLMSAKGSANKGLRNLRANIRRRRGKFERENLKPADVANDTEAAVDDTIRHPAITERAPEEDLAA